MGGWGHVYVAERHLKTIQRLDARVCGANSGNTKPPVTSNNACLIDPYRHRIKTTVLEAETDSKYAQHDAAFFFHTLFHHIAFGYASISNG